VDDCVVVGERAPGPVSIEVSLSVAFIVLELRILCGCVR
jgi:hypothetical protein